MVYTRLSPNGTPGLPYSFAPKDEAAPPPTPTPTPSSPNAGASGGSPLSQNRRRRPNLRILRWVDDEPFGNLENVKTVLPEQEAQPIVGRLTILLEPFPALTLTGRAQVLLQIEAMLEIRLPEAAVSLTGQGFVLTMDDRIRQAVEEYKILEIG